MSRRRCVMKDCGATVRDLPKRSLYAFPLHDLKRCKKWVDACDNDDIKDKWRNGLLTKSVGVCGEHFPAEYRERRQLPKTAIPIPYSKCTHETISRDHLINTENSGCVHCEHSYNKRFLVGERVGKNKLCKNRVIGMEKSKIMKVENTLKVISMEESSANEELVEPPVIEEAPEENNSEVIEMLETKPIFTPEDHIYFQRNKAQESKALVVPEIKLASDSNPQSFHQPKEFAILVDKSNFIQPASSDIHCLVSKPKFIPVNQNLMVKNHTTSESEKLVGSNIIMPANSMIQLNEKLPKVAIPKLKTVKPESSVTHSRIVQELPKMAIPKLKTVKSEPSVTCSRVIHSKSTECQKGLKNYYVFTDTVISRWSCVPHSQKQRFLSRLSKCQNFEPQMKVGEVTKTVNEVLDISFSDNLKEEETEIWDLHSAEDLSVTSVVTKSSWVGFLGRRYENTSGSTKFQCLVPNSNVKPVAKAYSEVQLKKPVTESVTTLPDNVLKTFSAVNRNQTVQTPTCTEIKVRGPWKSNSYSTDSAIVAVLGLTPRSEYENFDFASANMIFWTYDCGNGVVETVVECVSPNDKDKKVRVTSKEVIQQLLASNKKLGLLNFTAEKKRTRDKKKCSEHVKTMRRLKYKILQMQKELDAPKVYEKFLSEDQIEAMEKDSTQGHHWKDDTIVLAHNIRLACTTKGYKYLYRKLKWPLPSIKTLQRRAKELHLPRPQVKTVSIRKPEEKKNEKSKPNGSNENSPKTKTSQKNQNSSDDKAKSKRAKRSKAEKTNKRIPVNFRNVARLSGIDRIDPNSPERSIEKGKRKLKSDRELKPAENENYVTENKKIKSEIDLRENYQFPVYLDKNEANYNYVRLQNSDYRQVSEENAYIDKAFENQGEISNVKYLQNENSSREKMGAKKIKQDSRFADFDNRFQELLTFNTNYHNYNVT